MTAPNIEMIASSLRNCSLNGAGGGAGRRRGRRHVGGAEGSDDSEGVTVELNSDVPLPYHWEQCLDIRTGQVYYTNWEDGTRTTVDPRRSSPFCSPTPRSTSSVSRRSASTTSSGYTSASSVDAVAAAAWLSNANGGYGYGYGYGYDNGYGYDENDGYNEVDGDGDDEENCSSSSSTLSSAVSSTLSSFSPTDESASSGRSSGDDDTAGHVLVAAGCRACFMYFMVPKSAGECPKCGSSSLLLLGRSNNGYA